MAKNRVIEIEARVPKDYQIEYWYERDQEMPESEQEHVKQLLEEGYISGQLLYQDEKEHLNQGWWDLKKENDGH